MKLYEAMFLFDNMTAQDWSAIENEVKRLFERIGATQHVCVKFDERRLAYEIEGRKRGTYVLTYFDAEPERICDLERDAQLSELVLRMLVVRPKGINEEKLAALKSHPAETPLTPLSETRRGERGDRGDGDHRRRERHDRRDGGPRRHETREAPQPAEPVAQSAAPGETASGGATGASTPPAEG